MMAWDFAKWLSGFAFPFGEICKIIREKKLTSSLLKTYTEIQGFFLLQLGEVGSLALMKKEETKQKRLKSNIHMEKVRTM